MPQKKEELIMINSVVFVGRLVADPKVFKKGEGETLSVVAGFAIAVSNPGKEDSTSFFECKAFQKTAELAEKYLHKGSLVGISGRLMQRVYEKPDTHQKLSSVEILINDIQFLEPKKTDTAEKAV